MQAGPGGAIPGALASLTAARSAQRRWRGYGVEMAATASAWASAALAFHIAFA